MATLKTPYFFRYQKPDGTYDYDGEGAPIEGTASDAASDWPTNFSPYLEWVLVPSPNPRIVSARYRRRFNGGFN